MLQGFLTKLSTKEKKVFYITIVIVTFSLMDRAFFTPSLNKVEQLKSAIQLQKDSVAQDMRFLSRKEKVLKEAQLYTNYITQTIPEEDVINTEFFRKIEQLALEANVKLIKSNPAEKKDEADYYQYYADLDCNGELKNMISFMHLINTSDDLFKIVKFNMSAKRGVDNHVATSMTVAKLIIKPESMRSVGDVE